MRYAKILVKDNYEQRGDLVLRSYIRALKKIYDVFLLNGDSAFIYGIVDDNNQFHEIFTNKVINYDDYFYADFFDLFGVINMPNNTRELYTKIMDKVLFGKENNFDFEISTIEELAKDRAIEFEAYNKFMSRINPYRRLNDDNQEGYNDYNNFLRKIEEINIMKKMDNKKDSNDEYEVSSYWQRPDREEDYEYLVFEVPKVYKK